VFSTLIVCVTAAAVGGLVAHIMRETRANKWEKELDEWRRTAQALGLASVNSEGIGKVSLVGEMDALMVSVETDFDSVRGLVTRCALEVKHADSVVIEEIANKRNGGRTFVELGDPAIDEHFALSGSKAEMFALFDRDLRRVLAGFHAPSLRVGGGRIVCEYSAHLIDAEALEKRLREILRLGRMLIIDPADVERRLLLNARRETSRETRREIFKLLSARGSAIAAESASLGATDEDATIRLRSALVLDDFDRAASILDEEGLAEEERTLAYEHLATRPPAPWTSKLIAHVLMRNDRAAQAAMLRALTKAQRFELAPAISAAARDADSIHAETWQDIAVALGRLGGPTAEPTLLAMLSAPATVVRLAAIRALGAIGSVVAVESLHVITRDFLSHSVELRESAKAAIAQIQGRIENGDRARLSLIEEPGERGSVSYPVEEGALSLPPKD
jgi:hypothetical protein